MKKILTAVSFVLILFTLGCGKSKHFETPVSFYYPSAKITYGDIDGFISSEQREGADLSINALMEAYFRGPLDDTLQNPFPDNVSLIQCTAEDSRIQLVLSDSYAALTGTKLSVANACIAKTLTEYYDAGSISISCESRELDGEKRIIIEAADLILSDQSTGVTSSNSDKQPEPQ